MSVLENAPRLGMWGLGSGCPLPPQFFLEGLASLSLLSVFAGVGLRTYLGVSEFAEKPLALSRTQVYAESPLNNGREGWTVPHIASEIARGGLEHLVDLCKLTFTEFLRGTWPRFVAE